MYEYFKDYIRMFYNYIIYIAAAAKRRLRCDVSIFILVEMFDFVRYNESYVQSS